MVNQQNGVAVSCQIFHDTDQPLDVGRMQPNRRLIQHIDDSCCTISDTSGQLHTLTLSRGKSRTCPVEAKVRQAQFKQTAGRVEVRLADALTHRAHLFREPCRNTPHPLVELTQRHLTCLGQIDATDKGSERLTIKPCAVAIRTEVLLQELFDTLHAFIVLDLRQRVFHGINCIIIGEIHLGRHFRRLTLIYNVFLHSRPMIDDVFFFRSQILERNIRAHSHGAANIHHQGPHQ